MALKSPDWSYHSYSTAFTLGNFHARLLFYGIGSSCLRPVARRGKSGDVVSTPHSHIQRYFSLGGRASSEGATHLAQPRSVVLLALAADPKICSATQKGL